MCSREGWGYPSSGLNTTINICQANGEWSTKEVEMCVSKFIFCLRKKNVD